jgi:hypothetical protein
MTGIRWYEFLIAVSLVCGIGIGIGCLDCSGLIVSGCNERYLLPFAFSMTSIICLSLRVSINSLLVNRRLCNHSNAALCLMLDSCSNELRGRRSLIF